MEQVVVRLGQILRIGWVIKTMEAKVGQFLLGCNFPVSRGIVGRSQDRFPMVPLDFSVTFSFGPYHGPGVDSDPSENEYQEHSWG